MPSPWSESSPGRVDARPAGLRHGRGDCGEAQREPRPPGSALDRDRAAHRLGELADDREAEPGADRAAARVARVEEEALERALAARPAAGRGRRPRPRAGPGATTTRTAPPGGETRIAFSTRFDSACSTRSASPSAPAAAGASTVSSTSIAGAARARTPAPSRRGRRARGAPRTRAGRSGRGRARRATSRSSRSASRAIVRGRLGGVDRAVGERPPRSRSRRSAASSARG